MDDWRTPLAPSNLTLGRAKWAQTGRDIYLRAMAGINGTPMPESADALTPDQVWQIVHYVQALGAWKGSSRGLRELAAKLPPPAAVSP
jgi:mono/diheme cytochrome c family protein